MGQARSRQRIKSCAHVVETTFMSLGEAGSVWTDSSALAALVCAGADLDEPRHVMHYLYVLSEGAAYLAAAELVAAGWYVDVEGPVGGEDDWLVLAEDLARVVDEPGLRETRLLLQELAERFVGEYDGWEASV